MTKEQFIEYVKSAQSIRAKRSAIEDVIHKYNREPTLTMYPDLGEDALFVQFIGDALSEAVGRDIREEWEYAWYDCDLCSGDMHCYTADNEVLVTPGQLWDELMKS